MGTVSSNMWNLLFNLSQMVMSENENKVIKYVGFVFRWKCEALLSRVLQTKLKQYCTHTATGRQSLPTRPPSSSTSSSSPSSLPLSSSSLVSGNRPLCLSPPSSSIHHYLQRSPRLIPLWFQAPEVHHLHQRHPLPLRRHRHPCWPAWLGTLLRLRSPLPTAHSPGRRSWAPLVSTSDSTLSTSP